jgi:hypothetical protein
MPVGSANGEVDSPTHHGRRGPNVPQKKRAAILTARDPNIHATPIPWKVLEKKEVLGVPRSTCQSICKQVYERVEGGENAPLSEKLKAADALQYPGRKAKLSEVKGDNNFQG